MQQMTRMSKERIYELTLYHLKRIRDKLGLEIDDENLICNVELQEDKLKRL